MTATRSVSSGVHPSAALVRADALSIPLCDDSVDLVVTSPPYFALRSYSDDGEHYDGQIGSEPSPQAFLEALWAVTAECWRVLKPSGSLFVNLGDKYCADNRGSGVDLKRGKAKHAPTGPAGFVGRDTVRQKSLMGLPWRYAIGCIDGQADPDRKGWVLRSEIVWSKPNGLPESVQDRVRRSHEQWFHFTKEGQYYSAVDELREPHAEVSLKRAQPHRADPGRAAREGRMNDGAGPPHTFDVANMCNPLGKLPGSVWTVPTEPLIVPEWVGVDHFAAFPTEWPRRLILGWSPPDGVVLDPFGGTGTTAMVARSLGRFGVSLDLSADYLRLAKWRVFHSGHGAKAVQRTMRERQGSLL